MILEEVLVPETEEQIKQVLLQKAGNQAILKDEHFNWMHVLLTKEDSPDGTYIVYAQNPLGKQRLHYHDLEKLLIIKNRPDYKLPELIK